MTNTDKHPMSDKQYTTDDTVADNDIYATVTGDGRIVTQKSASKPELPDFHDDFRVHDLGPEVETLSTVFSDRKLLVGIRHSPAGLDVRIAAENDTEVTVTEDGFKLETDRTLYVGSPTQINYDEVLIVDTTDIPREPEFRVEQGHDTWQHEAVDSRHALVNQLQYELGHDSAPDIAGTDPNGSWIYAWANSYGLYVPVDDITVLQEGATNFGIPWTDSDVLTYTGTDPTIRERQNQLYVSNIQFVTEDMVPDTDTDERVIEETQIPGGERHSH